MWGALFSSGVTERNTMWGKLRIIITPNVSQLCTDVFFSEQGFHRWLWWKNWHFLKRLYIYLRMIQPRGTLQEALCKCLMLQWLNSRLLNSQTQCQRCTSYTPALQTKLQEDCCFQGMDSKENWSHLIGHFGLAVFKPAKRKHTQDQTEPHT